MLLRSFVHGMFKMKRIKEMSIPRALSESGELIVCWKENERTNGEALSPASWIHLKQFIFHLVWILKLHFIVLFTVPLILFKWYTFIHIIWRKRELKLPMLEQSLFMTPLESFAGTPLPGRQLPDFRLVSALPAHLFPSGLKITINKLNI